MERVEESPLLELVDVSSVLVVVSVLLVVLGVVVCAVVVVSAPIEPSNATIPRPARRRRPCRRPRAGGDIPDAGGASGKEWAMCTSIGPAAERAL